MKALSIRPDYVFDILTGRKTKEYRSWKTDYRGKLLICSTIKKIPATIPGHALCTVDLTDIKKLSNSSYAWQFKNVQVIQPIKVKGHLHLFDVDDELIKPASIYNVNVNEIEDDKILDDWIEKNYDPLYV